MSSMLVSYTIDHINIQRKTQETCQELKNINIFKLKEGRTCLPFTKVLPNSFSSSFEISELQLTVGTSNKAISFYAHTHTHS